MLPVIRSEECSFWRILSRTIGAAEHWKKDMFPIPIFPSLVTGVYHEYVATALRKDTFIQLAKITCKSQLARPLPGVDRARASIVML